MDDSTKPKVTKAPTSNTGDSDADRPAIKSLTLEEAWQLFETLKGYKVSDLDSAEALISAVSDRNPEDVIKVLSLLTRQPIEEVAIEVLQDSFSTVSLLNDLFIKLSVPELIQLGVVVGAVDGG